MVATIGRLRLRAIRTRDRCPSRRLASLASGKHDRPRLALLRVEDREQRRLVDFIHRIRDRIVDAFIQETLG